MRTLATTLVLLLLPASCIAPPDRGGRTRTTAPSPDAAPVDRSQSPAAGLLAEGDDLFRGRKYTDAMVRYEQAAGAAAQEGDRSVETEALSQVARMLSATERLEEGRAWLARAAERADADQPAGWTRYLGVRGIFERESGDVTAALATFRAMHQAAVDAGLHRRALDAAHHAAIVAPPAEQVLWAERGIAAAEALGEEGWLAVLWNNLGATYEHDLKDPEKAVAAYEKARVFHHRTGGERQKRIADWALGTALLAVEDVDRAEPMLEAALRWAMESFAAEETNDAVEWLGFASQSWGELRIARGAPGDGLALLRRARELLVKAGIETWWPERLAALDARIRAVATSE